MFGFSGPRPLKQVDLKAQMDGQSDRQKVADDFVAAFLHAGIPIAKLEHESILGLIQKYTKVRGCIPKHTGLYAAAQRVGSFHLGAIRKAISGKQV